MIFLLVIIILLLVYIAFFTPEKREQRGIRRVMKILRSPAPELQLFDINDPRNQTHPDEMVRYKYKNGQIGHSHRKLAEIMHAAEESL